MSGAADLGVEDPPTKAFVGSGVGSRSERSRDLFLIPRHHKPGATADARTGGGAGSTLPPAPRRLLRFVGASAEGQGTFGRSEARGTRRGAACARRFGGPPSVANARVRSRHEKGARGWSGRLIRLIGD
jgi:hypothetical protein